MKMMDRTEILSKLNKARFYESFIPSLQVNGKPEVLGLCCFHDDHNPSLSVNLETGLFRCFSCDAKGDIFAFYQKLKNVDFSTALKEIGEMAGVTDTNAKSKVMATFEYKGRDGKVLYIKERIEPGRNGRSKEFVFGHPENDRWVLGRGCDPILYNLPQVSKSKYAFIVEGEGKVDLLNKWGLIATSLDSGANSPWKDEYTKAFEHTEKVILLPDNDRPGREYASKIASVLHGKVKELKIVELPGLQKKEDIVDWAKISGNNKGKLIEIVKNTPLWIPSTKNTESVMTFTKLSDLFSEPEEQITWLVEDLLPTGGFSIVVAKPKVGKSTLARTLALHVAKGESFLDREVTKGAVVYLALEEKRSEVKRHFRDMGAIGSEEIHIYVGGSPVDAIQQIKEATKILKPVLVIIDPLFRLTKVKDGNDYIQVTNALEPLLRLARDTGTHVLCVHHSSKGEKQAGDSPLGSQAIFGSVDTLMVMRRYENYRTLQTIQRYGDDLEETILNFDKATRLATVGGTRQEQDVNMVKKAIIDFLSTQNEPITEAIINQGIDGTAKFKCKALRELVAENKISREGKGTKGSPFKYSTILLRSISCEVEKENPKTTENPHGCRGYSTSQDFDGFKESENSCEVESLTSEQEKNVFESDVLEVENQ